MMAISGFKIQVYSITTDKHNGLEDMNIEVDRIQIINNYTILGARHRNGFICGWRKCPDKLLNVEFTFVLLY